jgi:hypothetical protein
MVKSLGAPCAVVTRSNCGRRLMMYRRFFSMKSGAPGTGLDKSAN